MLPTTEEPNVYSRGQHGGLVRDRRAGVDAAKAFYGPLFGWSFAPDGAYTLITAPEAAGPSGGIFHTGGNIPPYAVFVVQVADVAATAAQAEDLGGKVVVAPMELEDGMVVAYLTDPNGSVFALVSPKAKRLKPWPPSRPPPPPCSTAGPGAPGAGGPAPTGPPRCTFGPPGRGLRTNAGGDRRHSHHERNQV